MRNAVRQAGLSERAEGSFCEREVDLIRSRCLETSVADIHFLNGENYAHGIGPAIQ